MNKYTEGMDLSFLNVEPKADPWTKCEVVFLGAEGYELYTMSARCKVLMVRGGFKTNFKERIQVPAEKMLGKQFKTVTVMDIQVRMPGITLSLGTMYPEMFPKVCTEGDNIGITT